MKAVYDSAMKEELGNGLQIKDQIIGTDGGGNSKAVNNNVNPSLEDEQFFETTDNLTGSTASKTELMETFNTLNLVFSNRINVITY